MNPFAEPSCFTKIPVPFEHIATIGESDSFKVGANIIRTELLQVLNHAGIVASEPLIKISVAIICISYESEA